MTKFGKLYDEVFNFGCISHNPEVITSIQGTFHLSSGYVLILGEEQIWLQDIIT